MVKGYVVPDGYMGLVKGKYQLFASENDYLEYVLINEEVQYMSYTLFNVPMYNERKAIRSLKRKGYTKNNCSSKAEFYFNYYRQKGG